jgi:hypothetical protein
MTSKKIGNTEKIKVHSGMVDNVSQHAVFVQKRSRDESSHLLVLKLCFLDPTMLQS